MKKLLTAILTAAAFAVYAAPAKQPAPAAKKAAPVRNVAIPRTAAELARQSEDNAARLIAKPATEMLAYYDADSRVVEQPAVITVCWLGELPTARPWCRIFIRTAKPNR